MSEPGTTYTFTDAIFEDSIAVQMSGPWLGVTSLAFNESDLFVGDVVWDEGYQFKIDIAGKTITLGARRNYGVPIACEEFFDAVVKDCDDIISYVNGAGVAENLGVFGLKAEDRLVLYEDAANHRIYVGLNFNTTDICKPAVSTPSPNVI